MEASLEHCALTFTSTVLTTGVDREREGNPGHTDADGASLGVVVLRVGMASECLTANEKHRTEYS